MSPEHADAAPYFFFREAHAVKEETQLIDPSYRDRTKEPVAETLFGQFDVIRVDDVPQLVFDVNVEQARSAPSS